MMPEVPICCLRLHGGEADALLIQCANNEIARSGSPRSSY